MPHKGFNCGNIVVKFAEPISVRHLLKQHQPETAQNPAKAVGASRFAAAQLHAGVQARGPGVDKTGLVVALAH
eukprot:3909639-Rhodomonas_salina.2